MTSDKDTECRLQIGDVCCSLRFKDLAYSMYLRNYYRGFVSEKEPEFTIDVNIDLNKNEIRIPDSYIRKPNETIFNFHSGFGILNLEEMRCTVFFSAETIRNVKEFMFQTYYTLIKNKYKKKNNFLVHACAVSRDGTGYVFAGRPESGKSTIARLSAKYKVLNDEIVIIKKENGSYTVGSSPFRGEFLDNENGSAPLKAVFLIKHEIKKNIIKKISKKEFTTRFLQEVICSQSFISKKREDVFLEMMDFCEDIAGEVPFYELQFLPDENFWNCIDNMEV